MKALIIFDLWLHKRVMNPTFNWVQKWFHCNRFQLIKWSMILWMVGMVITMPLHSLHEMVDLGKPSHEAFPLFMRIFYALYVLVFLFSGSMLTKDLNKASARYENYEKTDFIPTLMRRASGSKKFRALMNLVLIFSLRNILSLLTYEDVTALYIANVFVSVCIEIGLVCEYHLWDIDDVDPKDRENIFEPDTANDSV